MATTLTDEDLAAIDSIVERRISTQMGLVSIAGRSVEPPPLPAKLTVEQFAWCVQRSAYHVRERRRMDRRFRKLCQGRNPILIHPSALALFGVDSSLAAARLQQFPQRSLVQSIDTPDLPQS